jgi:alkylhydroperoxidase family enzyme
MARVDPLPVGEWPPAMRDAMAAMLPPQPRYARERREGRPKALNTLGTFAHHPALAQAFFTFNGHLLLATTLTERHRELVILRTAAVRKAGYEWAQHVFLGRDVGLTDEEISRVAFGPDAPFWDELDAALLRAVDELVDDGVIGDSTWAILAADLDAQQLLDLIFTVGAYETLAWMMRSFDLAIDDDIPNLAT